jgi:MFS family permease
MQTCETDTNSPTLDPALTPPELNPEVTDLTIHNSEIPPSPIAISDLSPGYPQVGSLEASDLEEESDPTVKDMGFAPVLKNRQFLTLWGGQVFSQLADKIYLVLMISLVSHRFEAPGQTISGWVSAVMIAFTIPAVVFGSVAGVYVDRHPKQRILVASNLLRGAMVLTLPFLLDRSQNYTAIAHLPLGFCLLLLITFLVSTLTQFFAPAEQAVIPLLVRPRHLLSANSLYTTTMMAAMIVGFAIGEPMLDWADAIIAHWHGNSGRETLVGGAYGIAGLLLCAVSVHEPAHHLADSSTHPWQDIQDGFHYLRKHPLLRSAIFQLIILSSIFAALAVLAVRLAEVIPQLEADQFGWLLSAGSVGMAIGAVLVGHFASDLPRWQVALVGSLGMMVALGSLAALHLHLWLTLFCILMLGLFSALVGIPMQTTIQEETPPDMRGKIFGLQNNLVNIALSLPLALAGLAESRWGLGWTLSVLAIAAGCGSILSWYLAPKNSPNSHSDTNEIL